MGKIKGIATLIEELVNLPIAQAAMRMTLKEWNTLISRARNLGAAPADIKKLEKIQKRKLQPSVGKQTPKGGSASVSEVKRINTNFKFDDKSGSAAIKAFKKNPVTKSEMVEQIKAEAKERGFSSSKTEQLMQLAGNWWEDIRHAASPPSRSPKDFRKSRMSVEELINLQDAELKEWANSYKRYYKRTKVKPTKPTKPFKKGGSVKRPSMQKGGAYKGKKHSYAAGGKVNKLNF
jgi:hypothetical protein